MSIHSAHRAYSMVCSVYLSIPPSFIKYIHSQNLLCRHTLARLTTRWSGQLGCLPCWPHTEDSSGFSGPGRFSTCSPFFHHLDPPFLQPWSLSLYLKPLFPSQQLTNLLIYYLIKYPFPNLYTVILLPYEITALYEPINQETVY